MQQRLQKIIAAAGYCSRRRAEELIAAGRVRVDGLIARLGEQVDADSCSILIDDQPLQAAENFVYVLLNKPLGTVTTLSDPQGRPVVTDLVRDLPVRLFPVGRLDINTSGLLLLTNDGALANRLAHPSRQVDKTYLVKVRGHLSETSQRLLEAGVTLDDGVTAPARLARLRVAGGHTWFELNIHEGRNRQARTIGLREGADATAQGRIGRRAGSR